MSASAPDATPAEKKFLEKQWTLTPEGVLVLYDDVDAVEGEEVGEVDAVVLVEKKVGDKVRELLKFFVPEAKEVYTVDWRQRAFGKTTSAPRLNQFSLANIKKVF